MPDPADPAAPDAGHPLHSALPGFFLLTFALTWGAWLASAAFVQPDGSGPVSRFSLFGLGGPVFLLGVVAPALVAIALTARHEGRSGVARLLRPIGHWRLGARWYLFALGYMATTKLLAALMHRWLLGSWPAFGDLSLPLVLGAILLSTWVQAGEEIGWRGYALPRLARHLGLGGASLLLGLVWAAWHLPLFYLSGSGSDGQSFPVYALHVCALSVAMGWLHARTGGSLLLVMLMHAAVNNTAGIVPGALPQAVDPLSFAASPMAWLTLAVAWAIALPLLVRMQRAGAGAPCTPAPPPSARPARPD